MLTLVIPGKEWYDEAKSKFVTEPGVTLKLEHSLASLSKWEAIFEKPFLGGGERTDEETLAYVKLMILTPDFPPGVIDLLTQDNWDEINAYLGRKQTATTINVPNRPGAPEVITSELIYYWMASLRIPKDYEDWPLNRLFMLLKVFDAKNTKAPKKSHAQMMADRRALNEKRRAELGTSG